MLQGGVPSPSTSSGSDSTRWVFQKSVEPTGLSAPGPQPERGSRAAENPRWIADCGPGRAWRASSWTAEALDGPLRVAPTGAVGVNPEVALQRCHLFELQKDANPSSAKVRLAAALPLRIGDARTGQRELPSGRDPGLGIPGDLLLFEKRAPTTESVLTDS